jgi:L-ribulose-5-phosphate 3-epimerase
MASVTGHTDRVVGARSSRPSGAALPVIGDLVAATPTCFLGFDPWVAIGCLKDVGITFVEIPALPARQSIRWKQTTFSPETLGTSGTRWLREQLSDMGVVPITVGAYGSILEPDDVQPLQRRIDFAEMLGALFVIIDAAGPEPSHAEDWRRIGTVGRFLADYAEARGIQLAFEIHEGLARSGHAASILLDAIDHDNVGVNYDTGNVVYYNGDVDPVGDVTEIADKVVHVHLKDTSGGRGDWAFGALGTGHVDLAAVIGVLRSRGFRGPFSLEIEGFAGEDLRRSELVDRVKASLDHLGKLGVGGPLAAGSTSNGVAQDG